MVRHCFKRYYLCLTDCIFPLVRTLIFFHITNNHFSLISWSPYKMIVHEMNELMFQIVCILLATSQYVICLLDIWLLLTRKRNALILPLKGVEFLRFPYPSVLKI